MSLEIDQPATALSEPATRHSIEALAELFTRGFEGATVPLRMTPERLSALTRADSIDLAASRVLRLEGRPAGFILVSSRGWTRRVAAMGVVPEARGRGLGHRLIGQAVEEARAGRFRRILLEVVEKNASGVRLYRDLGFETVRRLVGYERDPGPAAGEPGDDRLKEVDPREMAKVVEYEAPFDLPWQLAAETVAASGPPAIALRLEDKAYVLLSSIENGTGVLSTLVVPHAVRRQGWGLRLLRALFARFPDRRWRMPARYPENLAPEFFARAGFRRLDLAQLEMELRFDGSKGD